MSSLSLPQRFSQFLRGLGWLALLTAGGTLQAADPVDATPPPAGPPQPLRINQLQLVGTHNSYHIAPDDFAMGMIASLAPAEARSIDCTQRMLVEQLAELDVRHFELDLYLDPEGTLFREPLVVKLARATNAASPPFDPHG